NAPFPAQRGTDIGSRVDRLARVGRYGERNGNFNLGPAGVGNLPQPRPIAPEASVLPSNVPLFFDRAALCLAGGDADCDALLCLATRTHFLRLCCRYQSVRR